MSAPGTIHDSFFKQLMSEPATAGLFLRERLPPAVAALLSDAPPELLPGSFVDEDLAQHHSDLLFRTRLSGGGEALIYVLVEHKSAPEPLVGLQLLRYLVRLWEQCLKQGQARPLPAVIPLVVYHGPRPWNVPGEFTALFGPVPSELAPYLPAFSYALADLGRIADEDLSRQLRLRAFLKALKYVMRSDLPARIDLVLRETVTLDLVDVHLVLTYIDKGPVAVEPEALRAALRRLIPEREEEIMGAITQPFYEAGVKDGLLAGEAKGKAEGETKGKADALLRLLARRFGAVPDSVRRHIAEADLAALDRWFDAAFDAPSLDSLFPPSASH